jgi:hypothetical protein
MPHLKHSMRIPLVLFGLICAAASCLAEILPSGNVYQMCADADAIIIGDQLQGDTSSVSKWLKASVQDAPTSIVMNDLGKLSKSIDAYWQRDSKLQPQLLTTRHFVAFLKHRAGTWQSMDTIESSGVWGSGGMIWIQDGICYRYSQAFNPGPYDLSKAIKLNTETELLKAIDVGLDDAAKWNMALSTADPLLRAQALTKYTLASTSPESPRGTYRYRTREPLRKLGQTAVPALRSQLKGWRDGDSLNEVVLILRDIGPEAKAAVPDLVALLKHPERVHPSYVIAALKTSGNASIIDEIKPFLEHSDEQVRSAAMDAIKTLSPKKDQ